jgi:hypothetical protein
VEELRPAAGGAVRPQREDRVALDSWISSGGASRRITASSKAPMICGPCSSSTAVTKP